jgi:hypothetical protein
MSVSFVTLLHLLIHYVITNVCPCVLYELDSGF